MKWKTRRSQKPVVSKTLRVQVPLPAQPIMPKAKLPRRDFTWSPELAYAIGLITTDGYLSIDKRHIVLTSTDLQLIETFTSCLKKKNTAIKNPPGSLSKKPAFRVQIGDVVFYEWLLKIGLHANKSLTLGPLQISDTYFPDFLRGHVDGDGSIIYYKDNYNAHLNEKYVYDRLFVYFRSASKKHINWLRESISRLKMIRGSLNFYASKSQVGSNVFVLKFSTKEAKILLNWIYYQPDLPSQSHF